MSDPATKHPSICLNMIVRNEVDVVREVLDSLAPYIDSWVIVDTGSDDGTQEAIREHMATLGVPGKLHERRWRDFGHNRTEALELAQGHGDYIWVIDADDNLVGKLDLDALSADVYLLRCKDLNEDTYWQPWLFRDGVQVQWVGATHEYATWDYESRVATRLEGEYYIDIRNIGARNRAGQKLPSDRDLLLSEIDRDPQASRSVFYLGATYYAMGDFVNARTWYARRAEMGGWDQEVYFAMWRVAESMLQLGEPWPDVQDAYLRAWEFRSTRAEPLYAIARHYRGAHRYQLGYQFASYAAKIPLPEQESIAVAADVYGWRAMDEQAVCASWIDKQEEAFALCRQLVARPDLPDHDRQRCTGNRDVCVPTMIEAALRYPEASLQLAKTSPADISISLVAGPNRAATEHTLNSFVNCCTDINKAHRFLILDTGLSPQDRTKLQKLYEFLVFLDTQPGEELGAQLARIRTDVDGRYWLHLGQGWRFFAPDQLLTRLTSVLEAETEVIQVGINFTDATQLTGTCAPEHAVRRTANAGRYLLTDTVAHGPAMFDTTRLDRASDVNAADPLTQLRQRPITAGLHTATLDEVLCIFDA